MKTLRNILEKIVLNEVGIREINGLRYNEKIIKYLESVGIFEKSDEIAWCAAFVNYCLSGIGLTGTCKPNARSFLQFGNDVKLEDAKPFDICVFWRENPSSWKGHVSFLYNYNNGSNLIYCIGGNQDNSVCIKPYPIKQLLAIKKLPNFDYPVTDLDYDNYIEKINNNIM